MAADIQQIGSAGWLVAAALESTGQYIQSALLDVIQGSAEQPGLGQSLGILLYLISALTGIVIFAMGAQYKFLRMFVFGPALFYFTTYERIGSTGAGWRFGSRVFEDSKVEAATKGVIDAKATSSSAANTKQMKVAWFFARWDQFSTGIIQQTIALLNVNKSKIDLNFLKQNEIYLKFFQLGAEDPELKKFLGLAAIDQCPEYYSAILSSMDDNIDANHTGEIVSQTVEQAGKKTVDLTVNPSVARWIDQTGRNQTLQKLFPDKIDSKGKATGITCADMWRASVEFSKEHAKELIKEITGGDADTKQWLANKFKFTTNKNRDQILDQKLSNGEATAAMINELAVRMIAKNLTELNPNVAQLKFLPASRNMVQSGEHQQTHDIAEYIRLFNQYDQWQGKGDLLAAAQAMPYVQGMLLFFLAAAYPFFGFVLLVPGRHQSFLLWMGLWFWVKSWDLGFAVVMLIDDILYKFMPHGAPVKDDVVEVPLQALKAILQADPSFSSSVYYSLIAACMLSVPAIMGIFVKKGGAEVLDAVNQGFQGFSGAIGTSFSAFMRSNKGQECAKEHDQKVLQAANNAFMSAWTSPDVLQGLLGREFWKALPAGMNGVEAAAKSSESFKRFLENKPDVAKYLGGAAQKQFSALLAASSKGGDVWADSRLKIVNSLIKNHVNQAAYKQSLSLENRELAQKAVFLRYNTHDWMLSLPTGDLVDAMKADVDINYASVENELSQGLAKSVMRETKDYISGRIETNQNSVRQAVYPEQSKDEVKQDIPVQPLGAGANNE